MSEMRPSPASRETDTTGGRYRLRFSWIWIVFSVVGAALGPYQFSHQIVRKSTSFLEPASLEETKTKKNKALPKKTTTSTTATTPAAPYSQLPALILDENKTPPIARYTGEYFDGPKQQEKHKSTSTARTWSRDRVDVHLDLSDIASTSNFSRSTNTDDSAQDEGIDSDDEEDADEEDDESDNNSIDGPFQPAGQHLLVDIQNVDSNFLLDMGRLVHAMVQIITHSKLTLLSYHCHDLQPPMGVSCVGVLLESHVSIHTWPQAGILSLDLFTCGSQSLLPLISMIEDLFAIPITDAVCEEGGTDSSTTSSLRPQPVVTWSYKKRGYRDYYHSHNGTVIANEDEGRSLRIDKQQVDGDDIEKYLLGWSGGDSADKTPILEAETDFQQVQIFGTSSSNENRNKDTGALEKEPNKRLFLDGVMQSTLQGLEAYHEALVHPAMTIATASSHLQISNNDAPKRVAIIGGGEGATLREVLKHESVETCVMIEIDEELVELAQEHLQEWNDCSDFMVNSVHHPKNSSTTKNDEKQKYFSCFDDPRTELVTENAVAWFIGRFQGKDNIDEKEKFDVIIMDALDPSSSIEFSDILYTNENFVSSLVHALTDHGVLVVQVGTTPHFSDYEMYNISKVTMAAKFEQILHAQGMISMKSYSEAHGQFMGPWEYRISVKSNSTLAAFFREPSLVDLTLAKSARTNKQRQQYPFQYFDGPTWASMKTPSSLDAEFFCDTHPRKSRFCQRDLEYNPDIENIPATALEVKESSYFDGKLGLFLKEDFPPGSYLAIEQNSMMEMLPDTRLALDAVKATAASKMFEVIHRFFTAYGFSIDVHGLPSYYVDSSLGIFLNYDCNERHNKTASVPNQISTSLSRVFKSQNDIFNPALDSIHHVITSKQIVEERKTGDEICGDHLKYIFLQGQ